jgi:hypothetical protein
MFEKKLQLKPSQTIALVDSPTALELAAPTAEPDRADVVLIFVASRARLHEHLDQLQAAAATGKLAWIAYPKTGQLDTDLNRDIIRTIANQNGLDPVRQIAIDEVWSALRLKAGN